MNSFNFDFQANWWLILLALLAAFVYAFILYTTKHPWNKAINNILFGFRFLTVFFITLLTIIPLLRTINQVEEKPVFTFIIDNSLSVKQSLGSNELNELLTTIKRLSQDLSKKGAEVKIKTLSDSVWNEDNLDKIVFNHPNSGIGDAILSTDNYYFDRKVLGTAIITDGIVNIGTQPSFININQPVITIGVGDSTPKSDIWLKQLVVNKTVFKGNKFVVKAEINNNSFAGKNTIVSLREGDKLVSQQEITLAATGYQEVNFEHLISQVGTFKLSVEIKVLDQEQNVANNIAITYLQVEERKEKVLILAAEPHPDIKAIKSALQSADNYQVETKVLSFANPEIENFDIVIAVHLPTNDYEVDLLRKIKSNNIPIWYFAGVRTNVRRLDELNGLIRFNQVMPEGDQVLASFNNNFDAYEVEKQSLPLLDKMPPLRVPFLRFNSNAAVKIPLFQKVGNAITDFPLLCMGQSPSGKTAIMFAEGLWHWRLIEFKESGNFDLCNQLILKTTQYLSNKDQNKKFMVRPLQKEIYQGNNLQLETQLLNDLNENVYNKEIELEIFNEKKKKYQFKYTVNKENNVFDAGSFDAGIYQYKASTNLGNKKLFDNGFFVVKEANIEASNLTANFKDLRTLAFKTSGNFVYYKNKEGIDAAFSKLQPVSKMISIEDFVDIVSIHWILWLILTLLSVEWFVRKYTGGY